MGHSCSDYSGGGSAEAIVMAMTRGQMAQQIKKAPASKKKKKKKRKIPEKYLAGLSSSERAKRKKEITRNAKKSAKDSTAYDFSTDFNKRGVRRKTKPSVHTKKFKRMYGSKKS